MSEVNQLQQLLKDTIELRNMRDKALRLHSNPDFRDVILEAFCVKECARYAQLSADPTLSEKDQANSLALAQAAGHLRRYLSVVMQMGNKAESDIPAIEEEIVRASLEETEAGE